MRALLHAFGGNEIAVEYSGMKYRVGGRYRQSILPLYLQKHFGVLLKIMKSLLSPTLLKSPLHYRYLVFLKNNQETGELVNCKNLMMFSSTPLIFWGFCHKQPA